MSETATMLSAATPPNTVGCLMLAPLYLGAMYLGMMATEWLGWGTWPLPVISLALIGLMLIPTKSAPQTNLPAGAKIVAGLVGVIVIVIWAGRDSPQTATPAVPSAAPVDAPSTGAVATPRPVAVVTPSPAPSAEPVQVVPVSPAPVVTAVQILRDYDENQVRAQRLYDRALSITGRVVRVREALGTGILVLRTDDADRPLDLYFTEEGEPDLIDIRARSSVTATCQAAVELAGVIAMADCTAVSSN